MWKTGRDAARALALRSKDPSTKVGAVVVNWSGVFVGKGWNTLSRGLHDDLYHDRVQKLKGVVHAEVAAILDAGRAAEGATLVCTHHPCRECAKIIVAAGIECVECPRGPWRDDPDVIESVRDAKFIFERSQIRVRYDN